MRTEDTRAEITYLPKGSGTSSIETDARYFGDSDKPPEREISIGYVLDILRRRRKIVLWVMALSFCVGLFLALRPRTYLASGTLQIRPGAANAYRSQADNTPPSSDSDDRIESEVLILQSKSLLLAVADELHLYADPSIAGNSGKGAASDPAVQAKVVAALSKMVKIKRSPKTQIISVEATARSPLLASSIVSTLMNQYIHRIFETRLSSTKHASVFLTAQLDDLKKQVLEDQQKLVDLQKKLGVSGFDDSHNLETAQLEDLAKANQEASIERIVSEARYRILREEDPSLVEGGPAMLAPGTQPASSLLQSLRSSQAQIGSRYASVSEQFGPNYPETKQLKAQLAEATREVNKEESRIVEQAKMSFDAARRNQTMTSKALAHQKDGVFKKRNDMVEYQVLLHDFQASRALYEGLVQRLREAGVLSGIESGDVELVDLPTLPITPAGFGPLPLMVITLALGAVLAFITAMFLESFDSSFHSVGALERYMRLPALAVIPEFPSASQGGAFSRLFKRSRSAKTATAAPGRPDTLELITSRFEESIRMLHTRLLSDETTASSRTVLFTSATRREGVSTVAANVACVLAESGRCVLLVDANLRHPSHHLRFGLRNDRGFSNLVTGRGTLDQMVQPVPDRPNLFLLLAGPSLGNPGQLLAAADLRGLFGLSAFAYDFIVVDAPPALGLADVGLLLSFASAVVLVVREGVATHPMVAEVKRSLMGLGASLRGVAFLSDSYRSTLSAKEGEYRA
jgi:succinoglycan biosynthesis transport protein ExoP